MGRNIQEKDIMNGKLKLFNSKIRNKQGVHREKMSAWKSLPIDISWHSEVGYGTMLSLGTQDIVKGELQELASGSSPNSPTQDGSPRKDGRPSSMIIKKANTMFPAHLIAEAISSLRGLDLRWSGPITPSEMQYVQQYIFAKYPEYCNGLVEDVEKLDIDNLSISEESSGTPPHDNKLKSPKSVAPKELSPFSSTHSDLDRTQMEPSRLLDILTKKSSFQGNFISIPEVQARNRALKHCGLQEEDYLVLFMANYKDAMVMIGESYPFFRGNYYMTIVGEETDSIKEFASTKESRVISAPETWLDLRIKGSQLSQYFRRKCKYSPKGLFSYPATVNGTKYSMHWISEAHRNSWHVLLDATGLVLGEDRLALALYRPDFVLCTLNNTHTQTQPSNITCLLVRRKTFDTMTNPA